MYALSSTAIMYKHALGKTRGGREEPQKQPHDDHVSPSMIRDNVPTPCLKLFIPENLQILAKYME